MKKVLSKLLSLVLSLVLVSQIIPQQVYAEVGSIADIKETVFDDDYSSAPAHVDGEIEELRSESGKHFRLSDGTYLSVMYYQPVHFADSEGIWQDIDNTLLYDEDTNSYQTAKNGESSFSFSGDLSEGSLFKASWGEYEVTVSLIGEGVNNRSAIEIKEDQKD